MLEASLLLTLFVLVIFCLFDFGFSLFLHETYVHQARTGARYGAVSPDDLTAIKNMVLYNKTTGGGVGYMGLTPGSVLVARNGSPGDSDDCIVVTVSGYTFTWFTPGFAGKKTGKPIIVTVPVEN